MLRKIMMSFCIMTFGVYAMKREPQQFPVYSMVIPDLEPITYEIQKPQLNDIKVVDKVKDTPYEESYRANLFNKSIITASRFSPLLSHKTTTIFCQHFSNRNGTVLPLPIDDEYFEMLKLKFEEQNAQGKQ